MTPEDLKQWADAITAPTLLVIVGVACWRTFRFLGDRIVPKVELFLESTSRAIEEMPKSVESLNDSFTTIGNRNQFSLEQLTALHRDPDATFSTIKTNEMLLDLLKAKRHMADAILKISRGFDTGVEIESEIAEVRRLLEKWI